MRSDSGILILIAPWKLGDALRDLLDPLMRGSNWRGW